MKRKKRIRKKIVPPDQLEEVIAISKAGKMAEGMALSYEDGQLYLYWVTEEIDENDK